MLIFLDYVRPWQGPGGALNIVRFSWLKVKNLSGELWLEARGWMDASLLWRIKVLDQLSEVDFQNEGSQGRGAGHACGISSIWSAVGWCFLAAISGSIKPDGRTFLFSWCLIFGSRGRRSRLGPCLSNLSILKNPFGVLAHGGSGRVC